MRPDLIPGKFAVGMCREETNYCVTVTTLSTAGFQKRSSLLPPFSFELLHLLHQFLGERSRAGLFLQISKRHVCSPYLFVLCVLNVLSIRVFGLFVKTFFESIKGLFEIRKELFNILVIFHTKHFKQNQELHSSFQVLWDHQTVSV